MSKSPHVVIRASAGTGKTYQLTNRYLKLLLAGVPPQRILATTFTRKAAGEIFDRIMLRLAQAATDDDECRRLAAALEDNRVSQKRCRELLAETIRQMHRLRIGTLDSFFVQLAGCFALDLGLPLAWRIAEPLDDKRLRQEAVANVLAKGKSQELLTLFHLLTKGEVRRSVLSLVLGVTQDMYDLSRETDAAAWKQLPRHRGLSPDELAAAMDDLRTAPIPPGKQWVSGHAGGVAAAEAGDWKAFLQKGFGSKIISGERTYFRKEIPPPVVAVYQRVIDHAANVLLGELAQQTEATWQLLAQFASEYEQLKDQRRLLGFDDITWRLARRFDGTAVDHFAFRTGGGISHLLLDEFQDTSLAQWQVLLPLAQRVTTAAVVEGSATGSFFCVGDVKQAIYRWRGGLAEIFEALDGSLAGLEKSSLVKSYRSSQAVIDTVNAVFANLTKHPYLERLQEPVRAWQEAFPPHTTDKAGLAGFVRLQSSPLPAEGKTPADVHYRFAAQEIARLVQQAPGRSVGVLVRTNEVVARMIYELRQLDVPASEEGGNPLIDSPAVELLLSLLRIADHPGDTVARFHVARSPLGPLIDFADHNDGGSACRLSRDVRRRLLAQGYGETLLHFAGLIAPVCDDRDRSRLTQLAEAAFQYQPASSLRTDDFIRLVESTRVADPSSAAIRVMTIHQAKGLEFDIVVLPELSTKIPGQRKPFVAGRPRPAAPIDAVCRDCDLSVQQLLPPRLKELFAAATQQAVSEALCLLYVALTRAVHALHMIVMPNQQEKHLPRTYAGLLRAALTDGTPLTTARVVYEHGDPQWHGKTPPPKLLAAQEKPQPLAVALAPPLERRQRGLERTSPSALEGGRKISLARLLAPAEEYSFAFGTLVHAWLEQIEWLDDGEPDESSLRKTAARLVAEIGPLAGQVDKPLAVFRQMLDRSEIRGLLTRPTSGGDVKVLREHRFVIRQGDSLLDGSIDRLVLTLAEGQVASAEIVDYKTDAIDPGDAAALADNVAFYRPQLEAYCQAVEQRYKLSPEQVTGLLVFLSVGKVVPLGARAEVRENR